MYRVLFVLSGGLLLAACSSTPSWMSLDSLKPDPITDTVRFESEPPGADASVAGQSCKTPCSVNIPTSGATAVTFTLNGYQPDTEQLELVGAGDGTSKFSPNPVMVEMVAAAPVVKRPAPRKKSKPVAKRKPAAPKPASSSAAPAAAPAPAATAAAPPPPPPADASSPWPAPQPPKQ